MDDKDRNKRSGEEESNGEEELLEGWTQSVTSPSLFIIMRGESAYVLLTQLCSSSNYRIMFCIFLPPSCGAAGSAACSRCFHLQIQLERSECRTGSWAQCRERWGALTQRSGRVQCFSALMLLCVQPAAGTSLRAAAAWWCRRWTGWGRTSTPPWLSCRKSSQKQTKACGLFRVGGV